MGIVKGVDTFFMDVVESIMSVSSINSICM